MTDPTDTPQSRAMASARHGGRRWALGIGWLAAILICLGLAAASAAAVPAARGVIVLHSYHPGLAWTDDVHSGFMAAAQADHPDWDIFVEYLDAKRHHSAAYFDRMAALLADKYRTTPVAAVVTSDDIAFQFTLRRRAALFGNAPVIFCGVNDLSAYRESTEFAPLMKNVTGVVEAYDISETLATALRLHPSVRQVAVINDRTVTGELNERHIRTVEARYRGRVRFVHLRDLSMTELQSRVAALPADTIVLLMSFNRDREGRTFSYRQSVAQIAAHCQVPIYGVWSFYLGHGIVGGMLTDGDIQGRTAARLLARTLAAGSATYVPIVTESPNRFMFDYSQLVRFGLTPDQLPPGSIVIHQPETFVHKYRRAIVIALVVLVLQLGAILVLTVNIFRRKQAEAALITQKDAYLRIFESIQDAYYEAGLDGRILEVSPSIVDVLGYSRDMFLGVSFYDIYADPADREIFLKDLKSTGRAPDYELCLKHRDGYIVHCSVNARLLDGHDGEPAKIIGSMRNIEMRKQAEAEQKRLVQRLNRAQKLEAVGTLAGGVAHELNNILSGVTTYPELLLLKLADNHPLRQPLAAIQKSGLRAAAIVQDLLSLARRSVITKTRVQCNDVIGEYLDSLEFRRLKETHPDVHMDVQLAEGMPTINGSAPHLAKVVMHVIGNAVEAIVDGGQVQIRTVERRLAEAHAGYERIPARDYVTITVSDTGSGIAPTDLEKIFEPFYTTKKMGKSGTGLGMAVVWGTVHDHDGFVDIQSTLGKGTTLTIFLPTDGSHGRPLDAAPGFRSNGVGNRSDSS